MSKLQMLYTTRYLPPYMVNVHKDDREMGTVTRVWDHPSPDHPVGLLVIAPQPKDLSVDLVAERAPEIGRADVSPVTVNLVAGAELYISQDTDNVVIDDPQVAIAIAMRLLLWARLEQEKSNGTN